MSVKFRIVNTSTASWSDEDKKASMTLVPASGGYAVYIYAQQKDGKRTFVLSTYDEHPEDLDGCWDDSPFIVQHYDSFEETKSSRFSGFYEKANSLLDCAGIELYTKKII